MNTAICTSCGKQTISQEPIPCNDTHNLNIFLNLTKNVTIIIDR